MRSGCVISLRQLLRPKTIYLKYYPAQMLVIFLQIRSHLFMCNGTVVDYSGRWTKQVLDHFQHSHFLKMADISE